jgi:hypothetical protein
MGSFTSGERVHVALGGPDLDGIVFYLPSRSKVMVAIVDAARGPVMRAVPAAALTERTDDGPHDDVLRALVRRTPLPAGTTASGGDSSRQGRSGHSRAAMHRTTGK